MVKRERERERSPITTTRCIVYPFPSPEWDTPNAYWTALLHLLSYLYTRGTVGVNMWMNSYLTFNQYLGCNHKVYNVNMNKNICKFLGYLIYSSPITFISCSIFKIFSVCIYLKQYYLVCTLFLNLSFLSPFHTLLWFIVVHGKTRNIRAYFIATFGPILISDVFKAHI